MEGRNLADNLQGDAIDHEELEEQAQHHDQRIVGNVAEEAGAHAVGGVEDDAEDRVRRELHRQFDDLHTGLEDRVEHLRERMLLALDDRRQRPAEEQCEHHQGDDFTLEGASSGIDRVLRQQIHEVLEPRLVLRRGHVLLDRQHALVSGQCSLVELEADTRLEQVGRENGDEHRAAAEQDGVEQRETTDPAEAGAASEFHGAEHQRREDQRHDDHEDHAQEGGTDEGEEFGDPTHGGEFLRREVVIPDQAQNDAQGKAQQQLVVLLHCDSPHVCKITTAKFRAAGQPVLA